MEKMTVIALLDKYWQADTTLEEEKVLAEYFGGASVDPGLEQYREVFAFFEEEANVKPSADLGERILRHIGIAEERPVRRIRSFGGGLFAAAAVIAAIVIGLFVLTPPQQLGPLATIRHGAIQDTYDDPQQALAVVRHALLVASTHLNEGRQELTGDRK